MALGQLTSSVQVSGNQLWARAMKVVSVLMREVVVAQSTGVCTYLACRDKGRQVSRTESKHFLIQGQVKKKNHHQYGVILFE